MLHWVKTGHGWALNLDGSDAAERFALPRVELRATTRGWSCVCMLPDGTSREAAISSAVSVLAAKRAASELARAVCGAEYRTALQDLIVSAGG
jgi:hypothetical protein